MTTAPPPDHGDRVTRPVPGDVEEHLRGVEPAARRDDALAALDLVREVTGAEPVLWGTSMVGFGRRPYTTADGKEREWFTVGLAARRAALTFYGLTAHGTHADLLERLGPHTTGKDCLYVKRLADVDEAVLRELVARAWARTSR
ncbi:hypothetical protein N798_04515 [Knoellia flava TL1]|uniref:YdhG-like domain-containing protein n=2 Tax=Knoellia flava TaxID=913969 RepID=A0A8H9FX29_9MICO|nr:DUF1801 domain-containing protein [Knoellia flava]KGN35072.1 hypothetical protein N798_04515 [Knoellia flava TL1]GGB85968.1 hypothetical protein GCM10011314_27160 [Knoellia flava]